MIPDYPRIYLQPNEAGIGRHTWCQDRIEDTDIEYIRSDIADELVKRERQWCLSCGTITRTGRCDCSDDSPEAQRLVNYADEVSSEARKLSEANTALTAKVALLTEALEWYGERAWLARFIHSGGDPARFELSDDGGNRARRALSEPDKEWL